jgi:hypothetical protein
MAVRTWAVNSPVNLFLEHSSMRTASSATGATVLSSPWAVLRDNRRYVFAGLGFFVLFLVLLSHAPRLNSFYGSVDNLFIPVLGDTVMNRMRSAMTGEFVGRAMYPANILAFGETAFGTGLVFVALRFLGASDVVAVYLVQVGLLTSMALATTILTKRLTGSLPAGLLGAFIFTTCNFVWADIDNLPIHFYFFPLLSLYLLIKAAEDRNGRALVLGGILGGMQAYYSLQVFAYQTLLLAVFALVHGRALWKLPSRQRATFVLAYVLIALPLILFYLNTVFRLDPQDAWPRSINEQIYNLQLADLAATMPGKLISYPFVHDSVGGLTRISHSGFPGLVAPILAIIGLWPLRGNRLFFFMAGLVSLLFTLGTTVEIAGRTWQTPLVLFYKYFPLSQYLRVGLRAYTPVLLVLSVLAAFGWARVSTVVAAHTGRGVRILSLAAVIGVIAAENITWPVNSFELLPYPRIPAGYAEYFADKPDVVILDLPSRSTSWPFYTDDVIYALWQTKHQRHILGGVNGYYPQTRLDVQLYTDNLPGPRAFRRLQNMGMTHLVWHMSPFLVCRPIHSDMGCDPATGQRDVAEAQGPEWLDNTQSLELVFEDQDVRIYELK